MRAREKIIYLAGTFIFVALVSYLISYAFIMAGLTGNETDPTIEIDARDSLVLNFVDGPSFATANDIAPGWSQTKTFTIQNPEDIALVYHIVLTDISNDFINKADLVYTVSSTNGGGSLTQTQVPSPGGEGRVISNINIPAGESQVYTFTVSLLNSGPKNCDLGQCDFGSTFSFTIEIE